MAKRICTTIIDGKEYTREELMAAMARGDFDYIMSDTGGPTKEEGPRKRKKSLLTRAAEADKPEFVKAQIRKHGLEYDVENRLDAKKRAEDFIDAVGEEAALDALRKTQIEGAMAAFVWASLIDRVNNKFATADAADLEELAQIEADLLDEFDRKARSGGRFISALQEVYDTSDFGYKASTKIKQYKERNGGTIPPEIEAKFKEYEEKLNEVNKKIEELEKEKSKREGQQVMAVLKGDRPKTTFTAKAKKAADKFRSLKNKPFTLKDSSGKDIDVTKMGFSWNDVIEAGAKIIEKTGVIADGVAEVIKQISEMDWYKSMSKKDKDAIKSQIEEYFMREELEGESIKIPSSLIRDLVASGVDTIEELTDKVLEQVKEQYPDATAREVRDIITGYARKRSETPDDLKARINEQKRIGRLLSELEDLRKGFRKNKVGVKTKVKKDEDFKKKEKELLDQIKDASKVLGYTAEELEAIDAKKLENAKERIRRSIEDLQNRIKIGDFSKKEKRPYFDDSEMTKLRAEQRKWRDAFDHELHKAELENRTTREKWIDRLLEGWNLTRALMATGELSFMLVQGGVQTLSHPRNAARAFYKAMQHFASERKANEWGEFVKAQPWYDVMKKSKLSIAEFDARLAAREEQFLGGWVNNIWDLVGFPLKFVSKAAYEKWKQINFFKALERAGVGYLNTLRILRFLDGMEMLRLQGKNFNSDPQSYKNVADVINTLTGRASLGVLEPIAKPLSVVFFSPRNWASVLKTSTPMALYHFGKMTDKGSYKPSVAQKMAAADFMKFVHRHMIEQDRDRWFSKRVQTRRKLFTKIRNGLEDYDNFILSRDRNHYVNRLNDYIKSRYERKLNV